ncbi:efflux RND transporter periplasmic adaptor subunit [Leptospira langatensis]|uniref:Efflux RND transporter periplasmic adaptor subunit n=1 Tax=Leptospira langatensis TaxID=2484983 RepID=A0A5F1ZPK2_9LEPT|nr:efflux RND transporter periplasmic adaptor subunit [Leptospira langatensis]TGK05455.1 efflux RND transporter periplasmic adaptor subunit [Leptospira langatensis]TGL38591.1 efflux RND transporter periplasmic adaptor subunit [Leptospira langatensis]
MNLLKSLFANKVSRTIFLGIAGYLVLYFVYARIVRGNNASPLITKPGSVIFKPADAVFGRASMDASEGAPLLGSNLEGAGDGLSQNPQSVEAFKVEQRMMSPNIDVSGLVDFENKADMFSKIGGRLEKIFVKEGEEVSQGQKVFQVESLQMELELMKQQATLEASRSQARLAREKWEKAKMNVYGLVQEREKSQAIFEKAKEELEKARATFLAIEEVYKVGGLSKEEFEMAKLGLTTKETAYGVAKRDMEIRSIGLTDEDIAQNGFMVPRSKEEKLNLLKEINTKIEKAEYEAAEGVCRSHEAQVNSTKTMLKEAVIYSPMKGVVAKKYKTEGELLTGPGGNQAVLTIINIDKVYAVFNITETESTILKKGMRVDFSADVFPGSKFSGKIVLVSPLVDQKAHTVEVKALVENVGRKLKPGMFIRANIVLGEPVPTIILPAVAVLANEGDKSSVFVVKDGRSYSVEVKAGKKYGEDIEILQGLKQNDIVLLEKLSQLRDGMLVVPAFNR